MLSSRGASMPWAALSEAFADIEASQSDGQILAVYEQLKGHPKVKWKEGIKAIVGIEPALEDGMDI